MFENAKFLTRPLYLQVRDALVQRVVLGEWKVGAMLPNEALLSQEMGISTGTVRKALDQMEDERVLVRRQGRGTFVNDQSTCEMSSRFSSIKSKDGLRIEGTLVPQSVEFDQAAAQEADRLYLHKSARVVRVRRLHLYNERPFLVETCVLPEDLFPVRPTDMGRYRICVLAQANRLYLSGAEERVSAVMPLPADAELLAVDLDQPILALDRVIRSIDGRIVEWRVARCYLREKHYASTID